MNKKKIRHNWHINPLYLIIIAAMVICVAVLLVNAYNDTKPIESTMTYVEFESDLKNNNVSSVSIIRSESYFNVELNDGSIYTVINPQNDTFIKDILSYGIDAKIRSTSLISAVSSTFISISTVSVVFLLMIYLVKVINTSTPLYKIEDTNSKVTFDDVAGMSETKEELRFAVSQLMNKDRLEELGARPCKGIILEGPPGNGKTLLAKAIAGEANVPFISTSGSDFIEIFAGLGASRVREVWSVAEKNAPCVLFIDEIDAVGKRRTSAVDGSGSEANQTLNALLCKMDGINTNSGIMVIGATNFIESLDTALIRPGRFDKHIYVGCSKSKSDRDEIINLYLSKKKISGSFDFNSASKLMIGFSGAEIEQVINEAVMISIQNNRDGIIDTEDIDTATMKLRTNGLIVSHSSIEDINITAIHEAGHAVMSSLLGRKVSKVSITPYSSGIGGMTIRDLDEIDNRKIYTKSELVDDLMVALAGRAAEQIILGDTSTGCSNDLEKATSIAYNMIYKYGMIDKYFVNPDVIDNKSGVGDDSILADTNYLICKYNEDVVNALKIHVDDIKKLADVLKEEETVYNYSIS